MVLETLTSVNGRLFHNTADQAALLWRFTFLNNVSKKHQ